MIAEIEVASCFQRIVINLSHRVYLPKKQIAVMSWLFNKVLFLISSKTTEMFKVIQLDHLLFSTSTTHFTCNTVDFYVFMENLKIRKCRNVQNIQRKLLIIILHTKDDFLFRLITFVKILKCIKINVMYRMAIERLNDIKEK